MRTSLRLSSSAPLSTPSSPLISILLFKNWRAVGANSLHFLLNLFTNSFTYSLVSPWFLFFFIVISTLSMEFKISSKKLKLEVEDKHPPNSPKLSSKVISGGEVSQPPVAPTPERNNEEALINSDSPLTWPIDSEVCDGGMIVDSESSPRTPKAHTFDPFAPGEDNMGPLPLPPPIKKKSKVNVCRRLNFDNCAAESLVKESVIRRLNLDDCPIRAKEVKAGASSSSSLPSPSIGQVRQRPVPNKPPLPQKKTKASTFR